MLWIVWAAFSLKAYRLPSVHGMDARKAACAEQFSALEPVCSQELICVVFLRAVCWYFPNRLLRLVQFSSMLSIVLFVPLKWTEGKERLSLELILLEISQHHGVHGGATTTSLALLMHSCNSALQKWCALDRRKTSDDTVIKGTKRALLWFVLATIEGEMKLHVFGTYVLELNCT